MNNSRIPVLILSAHAIALGIARSLAPHDIPVYAVSYSDMDMAPKSKHIRKCYRLPHPEQNTPRFIEELLQIGKKLEKTLLLPADDPTLLILSKNLKLLNPYFVIPTPDWSIVANIISKDRTYQIAEQVGIPIPHTRTLNIGSALPTDELLQDFDFPFLLKPAQSHLYYDTFNCKMNIVKDREELETVFRACQENKIEMVAQEIIPGDDHQGYNYNALYHDGKLLADFCGRKIRMSDNGFGIPTVVQSCDVISELKDYSLKLLKALNYDGYSCIEFKYDTQSKKYLLLEINGRYNRSSLLCVKSGLNFPKIQYDYLVYGKLGAPISYQNNIYYIDEFRDLEAHIGDILAGRIRLSSFLKPYFSNHIHAIFSLDDIRPFLKRTGDGLSLLFHRKRCE